MRLGTFLTVLLVSLVSLGYLLSDRFYMTDKMFEVQRENRQLRGENAELEDEVGKLQKVLDAEHTAKRNLLLQIQDLTRELNVLQVALEESETTKVQALTRVAQLENQLAVAAAERQATTPAPVLLTAGSVALPDLIQRPELFATGAVIFALVVVATAVTRGRHTAAPESEAEIAFPPPDTQREDAGSRENVTVQMTRAQLAAYIHYLRQKPA